MAPQLDNNRIAIRERSLSEIFDLSLMVLRSHGLPLVLAMLVGVVPMMALNAWITGDIVQTQDWEADSRVDIPSGFFQFFIHYFIYAPWNLIAITGLLIYMEIPLASAPATLYLGQSMFQENPSARQIAGELWRSLPQMFLFQILLRGVCLLFWMFLLPPLIPFVAWPYLNEVILLERNPLLPGRKQRLTTAKRARRLMWSSAGDLIARWIGSTVVAILLVFSIWLAMWSLLSLLTGYWHSKATTYTIYLPLSVWIVISYFSVTRFLCYLDLRIRREGWEVELAMRAEAAKLTRQPV